MKKQLLIFGIVLFSTKIYSQTAISPTNVAPDPKAMLEVIASDKGLLLPRVDLQTVGTGGGNLASANPEALMVYNTNAAYGSGKGYYYWNGSTWERLQPQSSAGTVTNVSVTTANGVSGTVSNPTSTPAISLSLGAITPTSVAASGTVTGSNISGTNTGDQTITLTGDVTGSGTGSFVTTIGSNTVVSSMIVDGTVSNADLANNSVTVTAGTGLSGGGTVALGSSITLNNTAPDQTVSITGGGINSVTGTYPNFTVTGTEVDGSVTNELQTLSITGNAVTLSNGGGTVNVPAADGSETNVTAGTNIAVTGTGTTGNPYVVTNTFSEVDGSVSNELQTLSISGNAVTLSNGGGTVNVPAADGSETNVTAGTNMSVTGTGTTGNPYVVTNTFSEVDGSVTNEAQTISAAGGATPTINLSTAGGAGGGTVTLSPGTGVGLSQTGNTITVTNTAPSSGGTVTNVSVTSNNGITSSVTNSTSTPAITLGLGAITPSSVAATGTVSGTQLISTVSTGTAPLVVTSTTPVANLNIGGNAATVTTNANLTGAVVSTGNVTSLGANAITSADLANDLTDETGTGAAVFGTSPALGGTPTAPTAAPGTSTTQLATTAFVANANATNANLTGPITSSGNVTSVASQTGTGSTFVMNTSPTLVTPNLGTPTAATLTNATGLPLTTGVTGVLPIANGGTNSGTALSGSSIMVSNGTQVVQGQAGTTTTVLHGNAAGAPTYGGVVSADITDGTVASIDIADGTVTSTDITDATIATVDLANNSVTNPILNDMAVNTIKGRITAGTGDPEDLSAAQVRTILGFPNPVNGLGTTNYVPKWTPNGSTLGNSLLFDNATNVGIGNAAPNGKLDVVYSGTLNTTTPGNTLYNIHLTNSAQTLDYATGITFGNTNNSLSQTSAGIYVQTSGAYGSKMYFGTTDSYVTGSKTRMMIDHLGNVGIGNTAPAQKLDVTGNIRATGAVIANANGAPYLIGGDDATLNDVNVANTVGVIGVQNTALGSIQLGTSGGTISGSAGNVGIGTIGPNFRLDVQKDITMDGDLTPDRAQFSVGGTTNTAKRMIMGYDVTGNGYGFIKAGNYGVAWTNLALQPNGGNVGIGTTSPTFKLHVPSGYIGTDYIFTSDNSVATGITGIMVKQGDNYHRTGTAAAVASFLNTTGTWIPNNGIGDWQIASSSTSTGFGQATLELRESNFTGNGSATPPHLGFHWGGVVASNIALESSGRIAIRDNPGSGYENLIARDYFTGDYGTGLVGNYSSTVYQNVFAMGAAYRLAANGSSPGNLYGLAWTHTNVGGQSKAGLGHQLLVMDNGVTYTALGNGIWTRGDLTFNSANPYINASSYFVAPGGAYFNSQTVYAEADMRLRGGLSNDGGNFGGDLQINDNLRISGVVQCLQGTCPPNSAMRMTPNFHLNSPANYAIILNWDNGVADWNQRQLRVGNGQGSDGLWMEADQDLYTSYSGGQTRVGHGWGPNYCVGGWYCCSWDWLGNCSGNCYNGCQSTQWYLKHSTYGSTEAYAYWGWSDGRYKQNVSKISGALDIVKKMRGVTYDWKELGKTATENAKMYGNTKYVPFEKEAVMNKGAWKSDVGLIAQELKEVFPVAVKEIEDKDSTGAVIGTHMVLNYDNLIPILIEAIKEQQEQIDELKSLAGITTSTKIPEENKELIKALQAKHAAEGNADVKDMVTKIINRLSEGFTLSPQEKTELNGYISTNKLPESLQSKIQKK